jgi:hypothetical protein
MDGRRKRTSNTAARRAVHPMRGLSGVLDQREVFLAALALEPPGKQNRIVVARLYGGSAWAAAALVTCARQVWTRSD